MTDTSRGDSGQTGPETTEGFRIPRRTWLIWIVIFLGIILLMLVKDRMNDQGESINQHQLEELVDSGLIAHATIFYDPQSPLNEIVGIYYKGQPGSGTQAPFRAKVRLTDKLERELLSLPQTEVRQPNTMLLSILRSVLPFVVLGTMIWFFFIRQIRAVSKTSHPVADLHAKTAEQQTRFDKILDRWEQQANRMDSLLDKMERNTNAKQWPPANPTVQGDTLTR